jgi:epoxyqueuosine reductase
MDTGRLKSAIVDKALRVGFDRVGFAPARLPGAEEQLADWLSRGYHGEMGYLARAIERRTDASRNFGGTATVVCCALNYYQGAPARAAPGSGVISSYAQGEDYHRVLERKLADVASFIETEAGVETKIYVDTGPVLEKAYAVAAGLGWLGKHTNLIAQKGSSWFFLGEILVPLALEIDRPQADRCGSCTRCITACPTGAIVAPYVLDSRLCISYLTIELRGFIPRGLRPLIGTRIYGCDDCQDVCPWNRFAAKSDEAAFLPREPLASMDLVRMLRMSREEFLAATRGSAMRRARYAGFLRNVAVALGNARDRRAVPALVEAVSHEEPLVRGHAAWALGAVGERAAIGHLEERLRIEKDDLVRDEIDAALRALGDPVTPTVRPRRP